MDQDPKSRRERLRGEAAEWVVRLSDTPAAHDRDAFETWRAQSVDHEIAYEQEMAAWERLDRLSAFRTPEVPPATEIELEEYEPSSGGRVMGSKRWRAVAAGVLAMLAFGGAADLLLAGSPAYATAVGERRTVRLDDGSLIELNTDSRIVVRYGRSRRLVELVRGEAMFKVARGARPFVIVAHDARLNSGEGELAVRVEDESAKVTVKSGTVLATGAGDESADRPATSVAAGSEAIVGAGPTQVHRLSAHEIERLLAWRQGRIALEGQTLAEAVDEFNRYNLRKIEIADARAGGLRVGGYFQSSDVEGFVAALTKAFPVRAVVDADGDIRVNSTS